MNLPAAISSTTTSFAEARKSAGLGMLARERAEDELRHRHVGRGLDPVTGHVAEHDGEPVVAELEEVVDVAADVDARRRLVHLADLEPLQLGMRPRQERAAHRVRELLLLLVEAPVVDRERRLRGDRQHGVERLARDRPARVERHDRQRPDHLARASRSARPQPTIPSRGTARAGGATRRGPLRAPASSTSGRRVRNIRRTAALSSGCGSVSTGDTASTSRASGTWIARQTSLSPRSSGIRITAASTWSKLHRAPRERLEGRVEREALRERLRHLVQRAHAPRSLALRVERDLPLGRARAPPARAGARSGRRPPAARRARRAAPRRTTVTSGAASGYAASRPIASPCTTSGSATAAVIPASPRGAGARGHAVDALDVGDGDHPAPAVRPERELEQRLGDDAVRPGELARGRRLQAPSFAEVHGDALRAREERRRGRARSRARARARAPPSPGRSARAARGCGRARAPPRARRSPVRSACAARTRERRQPGDDALVRVFVEDELEDAGRRLAEPDADDGSASDPFADEEVARVERDPRCRHCGGLGRGRVADRRRRASARRRPRAREARPRAPAASAAT